MGLSFRLGVGTLGLVSGLFVGLSFGLDAGMFVLVLGLFVGLSFGRDVLGVGTTPPMQFLDLDILTKETAPSPGRQISI